MLEQEHSLEAIQDIKRMMERSSRFISLSGYSGISAGICALVGAWLAHPYVFGYRNQLINTQASLSSGPGVLLNMWLFWIAAGTFVAALLSAFFFTYFKSKKEGIPIWGNAARRLMVNVGLPLLVGAIFLFKLFQFGTFGLIAPGCLLFYGLALINAGKYTLAEIRYLGLCEIILGIASLGMVGYGLYFWAIGFGVLHIAYGLYMWNKYDRTSRN